MELARGASSYYNPIEVALWCRVIHFLHSLPFSLYKFSGHSSLCPLIHPSTPPSIYPPIHPFIHPSIHSSLFLTKHPFSHSTIKPFPYISIHLSFHPFMHPYRLSYFTFTFHFHALETEMATHSSVLAWRIPGMGEPGGLPSMGSHRVGHDWSNLAAAAAA